MTRSSFLGSAALLALAAPAFAQGQPVPDDAPIAYPENSGLDAPVDEPGTAATQPPATSSGNPVLDRLEALEARIRQLEARNAVLEEQAGETATRVQKVEVRAATAVQPGPAPTFSDVGGNFTFKPRGTIQLDQAAYNGRAGGYDFNNGTDIRRARLGFDGTAFRKFKYRIEAELVKKQVTLLDAYVQYPVNPKLTLTLGQHKAPYGLEANSSDALNSFLERGMASNAFGAIGAERRVGASLGYSSDHLHAQIGLFGAAEDVVRNAGTPDEAHGVNARIVWEPLVDTGRLVHLGLSGYKVTNLAGGSITVSERPNSRVDDGRLVSASVAGATDAAYIGAEAAVVRGPLSLQGEYGRVAINRADTAGTATFDGFYVFGSWFLTGESRSFKGGAVDRIKPLIDFDPTKGQWGALELLLRYDQLDLGDADLSPLSRTARSWTGGVNWYLNPNARVTLNYIRFSGENSPLWVLPAPVVGAGDRTAKGDVIGTRLQFDF